ncbi:hypothetical protein M9H77_25940 [Catharanthus roseus]|uniref:Uncharacterized protein n=1 Tax=Catharanthus roseus TaxID=4058 RepID=A0ACC0A8A5_CATRO|nr:hypothetical protein M9H77_25940 [Catharanthus roseus]
MENLEFTRRLYIELNINEYGCSWNSTAIESRQKKNLTHNLIKPLMSEQVNNDLSLSGKIPSGLFNSMFNFKGNWKQDAKLLAFDGCFIALSDRVKLEIPSSWNPAAIAKTSAYGLQVAVDCFIAQKFVDKYGTHIVVGGKMGGKDVFPIKQLQSSNMEQTIRQQLLTQLADRKFTEDTDGSLSLN